MPPAGALWSGRKRDPSESDSSLDGEAACIQCTQGRVFASQAPAQPQDLG